MTGELWKNEPPFRLALNRAASDDIAWHCKHYAGRGEKLFYESRATVAEDMGVPVSKMEESIEARIQASLKTARDPDGGPYPVYQSGKTWYDVSGKTGSGKKFSCREPVARHSHAMSIAWSSAAWQEELVPGSCWATTRKPLLSRRLLVERMFVWQRP